MPLSKVLFFSSAKLESLLRYYAPTKLSTTAYASGGDSKKIGRHRIKISANVESLLKQLRSNSLLVSAVIVTNETIAKGRCCFWKHAPGSFRSTLEIHLDVFYKVSQSVAVGKSSRISGIPVILNSLLFSCITRKIC